MSATPPDEPPEIAEDSLYGGRVRLLQPRGGHRAGTDAVLLAAALETRTGEVVVDAGAGSGAVGLMMAARSEAEIAMVERDPLLARLCGDNIALNDLAHRARIIEADLLAARSDRCVGGLLAGMADVVVTNPPFFDAARSRPPADRRRAAAHILPEGGLERWLAGCAHLLRPKGRLALVHRADRLGDCLRHLSPAFGQVCLRAVHPRADAPAIRLVLTAVKGSRAPLTIRPCLVLHAADGSFALESAALHRGEGWLM